MYCPHCNHETGAGEPLGQIGLAGNCDRCGTRFVVFYQLSEHGRYTDLLDYDKGCEGA